MPLDTQDKPSTYPRQARSADSFIHFVLSCSFVVITGLSLWELNNARRRSPIDPSWDETPAPLVMEGGDPYIRALMRIPSPEHGEG